MDEIVTTTREPVEAPNPFPPIHCECGETWTQEMHTVCPNCARWPDRDDAMRLVSEPDSLRGLSNERALEAVLKRLAGDPSRGAAIAASAVEEALRQLRKRERRACG